VDLIVFGVGILNLLVKVNKVIVIFFLNLLSLQFYYFLYLISFINLLSEIE